MKKDIIGKGRPEPGVSYPIRFVMGKNFEGVPFVIDYRLKKIDRSNYALTALTQWSENLRNDEFGEGVFVFQGKMYRETVADQTKIDARLEKAIPFEDFYKDLKEYPGLKWDE